MIKRVALSRVTEALDRQPAVVLLGPRQVGKTTLALQIAGKKPALYLDLEDARDRAKLADPGSFLEAHERDLVILDEIHRLPELFQTLRGLIDSGRRRGIGVGRYLLLGSASMELLRQSGESLAGRVAYLEMAPFSVLEVKAKEEDTLWVRGGFPDSFLAKGSGSSLTWRDDAAGSCPRGEATPPACRSAARSGA